MWSDKVVSEREAEAEKTGKRKESIVQGVKIQAEEAMCSTRQALSYIERVLNLPNAEQDLFAIQNYLHAAETALTEVLALTKISTNLKTE